MSSLSVVFGLQPILREVGESAVLIGG